MKKILFFNIGSNDIKIKGNKIENSNIREEGKKIFENYENEKSNLNFEIIQPFLDEFKEIERVYLFVTNQEDVRYRKSDTIYFGRIIKKWIEKKYNLNVRIKEYGGNPTDISKVFNYFSDFSKELDDSEMKICSLSGGVPTMNNSMFIVFSSFFNNVEFYQVDRYTKEISCIPHKKTIVKEFVKKSSFEFLNNYNYLAIKRILLQNLIVGREKIIHLLDYAQNRLYFNFEEANKSLDNFLKYLSSLEKKEFENYKINFKPNSKDIIAELFWNMEVKLKNREYVDFLGRLFRFEEAVLYYLINGAYNIDISKKENHQKFFKKIKNNASLKNKLNEITYKGQFLNLEKVNRPVLFFILYENESKRKFIMTFDKINKYLFDEKKKKNEEKDKEYLKTTECLGDLRNRSIIAHGFQPVSKKIIEELYGNEIDSLRNDCEKVVSFFFKNEISNPFDKINTEISKLLYEI